MPNILRWVSNGSALIGFITSACLINFNTNEEAENRLYILFAILFLSLLVYINRPEIREHFFGEDVKTSRNGAAPAA